VNPVRLGLVVEGHGEVKAAPILLRRIAGEIDPSVALDILKPIRQPRDRLVKAGELERAVELAALNVRPSGGVIVLLDSDDDCPAILGPELLKRAQSAALGLPVFVILPQREFEAWFLAAAKSLRGQRGLSAGLESPQNPEEVRGAKEWLRNKMHEHRYSPTIDQPALAAIMDLNQARAAASFDKCYRDLRALVERFRE
jgi:hypothetical protein